MFCFFCCFLNSKWHTTIAPQINKKQVGGSTPKGLLVGTVEKVSDDDYGLPSKIYIKPAADLDDLSFVTIAVRTDD